MTESLVSIEVSNSAQRYLAFVSLGRASEKVLHLHTLRRCRRRQTSMFEHAEEFCSSQTQLHVRKVHSDTSTGACAQWMEGLLCFAGHFIVDPARQEISRWHVLGSTSVQIVDLNLLERLWGELRVSVDGV